MYPSPDAPCEKLNEDSFVWMKISRRRERSRFRFLSSQKGIIDLGRSRDGTVQRELERIVRGPIGATSARRGLVQQRVVKYSTSINRIQDIFSHLQLQSPTWAAAALTWAESEKFELRLKVPDYKTRGRKRALLSISKWTILAPSYQQSFDYVFGFRTIWVCGTFINVQGRLCCRNQNILRSRQLEVQARQELTLHKSRLAPSVGLGCSFLRYGSDRYREHQPRGPHPHNSSATVAKSRKDWLE